MDPEAIKDAINQTMPFGKYAGRRLFHLPETYLVWFNKQGFPEGKLGYMLWQGILETIHKPEVFKALLLAEDERTASLRRETIFTGILTEAERAEILAD